MFCPSVLLSLQAIHTGLDMWAAHFCKQWLHLNIMVPQQVTLLRARLQDSGIQSRLGSVCPPGTKKMPFKFQTFSTNPHCYWSRARCCLLAAARTKARCCKVRIGPVFQNRGAALTSKWRNSFKNFSTSSHYPCKHLLFQLQNLSIL